MCRPHLLGKSVHGQLRGWKLMSMIASIKEDPTVLALITLKKSYVD